MKQITIIPEGYKILRAMWKGQELGMIEYRKWFSTSATITVAGTGYTLGGRGFWGTVTELKRGDRVLLEGRYKWKGLSITDPKRPGQEYMLKLKGFFRSGYVLLDYKGNEVMSIESDFNWKSFKTSYSITCDDAFGDSEEDILLMLVTVHFYKMYQAMAASGTNTAVTV